MEILYSAPLILTKDRDFAERVKLPLQPGQVLLLPEDAILVNFPEITHVEIAAAEEPILEPDPVPSVHAPAAKGSEKQAGKGAKTCKHCGKPGHMQKTCPKKRLEDRALEEPADLSEPDDAEVIAEDEDVVAETAAPGSHEVVNMTPMSKQNYEVLKEMQLEGADPRRIQAEIGWDDLDDVEVALKSNSYFAYTFDRKKVLQKKMQSGRGK